MGICKVGAESHGAFTHPPAGYILPHCGAKLRPEAGRHSACAVLGHFMTHVGSVTSPRLCSESRWEGERGPHSLGFPCFSPARRLKGSQGSPRSAPSAGPRCSSFHTAQASSASPPGFLSEKFPEGLSLSLQSIPLSLGLQTCAFIATLVGFQEGDCVYAMSQLESLGI